MIETSLARRVARLQTTCAREDAVRRRIPDGAVVVSPHCDDAVLSLGAALASARGRVTVLTVMAGDPRSSTPPGPWDAACGFPSAGAAAAVRRQEDVRACTGLGVRVVHVDEVDEQYPRRYTDDDLWEQVQPWLQSATAVLLPGNPLRHPDHRQVVALALSRLPSEHLVQLYREEPYALNERSLLRRHGPIAQAGRSWVTIRATPRGAAAKRRAVARYRSQLPLLQTASSRPAGCLTRALQRAALLHGEAWTVPAPVSSVRPALAHRSSDRTSTAAPDAGLDAPSG